MSAIHVDFVGCPLLDKTIIFGDELCCNFLFVPGVLIKQVPEFKDDLKHDNLEAI